MLFVIAQLNTLHFEHHDFIISQNPLSKFHLSKSSQWLGWSLSQLPLGKRQITVLTGQQSSAGLTQRGRKLFTFTFQNYQLKRLAPTPPHQKQIDDKECMDFLLNNWQKKVSMSMPTSEKLNYPDCHSHRPADTIETRDFVKHNISEK